MASTNKNPYRDGSAYNKLFAFIRSKQVVTVAQLSEAGFKPADITVVLSPRAVGTSKGDPRGNLSSQGHVYYMERLPKKNKGEAQRFRIRWRKEPMEKRTRHIQKELASQKVVDAPVDTPVKTSDEVAVD